MEQKTIVYFKGVRNGCSFLFRNNAQDVGEQ